MAVAETDVGQWQQVETSSCKRLELRWKGWCENWKTSWLRTRVALLNKSGKRPRSPRRHLTLTGEHGCMAGRDDARRDVM